MASMISQLYHDELRLSERDYPEDSRAFILLDSFKEDAEWLQKMLDGPAKEHLLKAEVRHFSDQHGDALFVRNLYETRRMQYTIYNALGKEPSAWRDGRPLATVQLTIPAEYEAYTGRF